MTALERLAALVDRLDEEQQSEVAHALRTPLAVIRGYAELLGARRDQETQERAAGYIVDAAEQLQAAVDTIFTPVANPGLAPHAQPAGSHGVARVLVVDDDDRVRTLLRLTLPSDAYSVTEAVDGAEAIGLVPLVRPDLVLLDLNMPFGSGAVVLAVLKRDVPDLPVLVLTADGQESARKEAVSLGADGFLTKPFSPLELLACVERLIPVATQLDSRTAGATA